MAKDLVSIIMPVYNSKETIEESIASAVAQHYENIELIIVDDGSNDGTADLCRKFVKQDKRIKFFFQTNKGVSAARNTGIKKAEGDFFSFLDADDLWDERKIELQIAAAKENPEAVILSQLQRFSGNGTSRRFLSCTSPPKYQEKGEYLRALVNLKNHDMANFGTALIRKRHLETVGLFDENLHLAEDWDLWLRLAVCFPFVNVNLPLRLYRKHQDSLTMQNQVEKALQYQLAIIDKLARSGLMRLYEIRAAKLQKCLEFYEIFRYRQMRMAAFRVIGKGVLTDSAGIVKIFWGKLCKKISN